MTTIEEIKHALRQLPFHQREELFYWNEELSFSGGFSVQEPQPAHEHPKFMTLDEFLEFARQSPFQYEFVNGLAYPMNGPTVAHVRIAGKLLIAFSNHLRGGPCEALGPQLNLLIRADSDQMVYHPDLTVACNREEAGKDYLCNPKLVAEILSPSTRRVDLREKAISYHRVPSIEEYVVLEQDDYRVLVYRRTEWWKPQVYAGVEAVVELQSIDLSLPICQIYEDTLPAV